MKPFYIIAAFVLSFSVILAPCHATSVYMWTDEQGVAHISDQPPPKGVEATSFSTERDYPETDIGGTKAQEQRVSKPMELDIKKEEQRSQSKSEQDGHSRQESQKAHPPQYRDEASLSRDEKIRLLLLDANKEHASKLYSTSSSEEERRRWKAELDKIHAEENEILKVRKK